MKKGLMLLTAVVLLLASYRIGDAGEKMLRIDKPTPIVWDVPPINALPYYPSGPGLITQSPGDTVGFTQYDYQTNGSTGNRVALDSQGGKHFVWMNGIDFNGGVRDVYFNYVDVNGVWVGGAPISGQNLAGYINLALTSDDRAVAAYHQWLQPNYVVLAVDQVSGFGIFNIYDPPDMLSLRCFWPYVTVDRNDYIHIVSCENAPNAGDPQALSYCRSEDEGATWSRIATVDTLMDISQNVVSSPVSDKVAIVYTHPLNYDNQWNNDIYYIESEDGTTWDFTNGKVNVTGYGAPDSLYAYTDLAAIYDYNDNLNIIWNAQWVTDAGVYFHTFLYHYNEGLGEINMITETDPAIDTLWDTGYCQVSTTPSKPFGAWNRPLTKMSLGVRHDNVTDWIVALWTQFDPSDCSANGWANGDLYYSYSPDFENWSQPVNVTNSNTDGCQPGECDSDHWSTLADVVDDSLHIIYINDKDAGGISQSEGSVTDNPVMYLSVIPLTTGVSEDEPVPVNLTLSQNYPNPFNARTNIEFELLENSTVELSVYDITGARVAALIDGEMQAGRHTVNWDAGRFASGIYYYSLRSGGQESTRRMTLLK